MGSPHAARVDELRRARREYRSLGLWTTLISTPVLELYRKFSPEVVRDMNSDASLREAMQLYAVQPVFHLFQMAESHLRATADDDALMSLLDGSVDEYVNELAMKGVAPGAFAHAAAGAALAAGRMRGEDLAAPAHGTSGPTPLDLYLYLASRIGSIGDETGGYAWAFEGLEIFFRRAADRASADRPYEAPAFVDDLGGWLARLPIPVGALLNITDARSELQVLAQRLFIRPGPRARFAHHLLARWPATTVPALRALLSELEFLSPEASRTE